MGKNTNTTKQKHKDLCPPSRRIHILAGESHNILLNSKRAIGEEKKSPG